MTNLAPFAFEFLAQRDERPGFESGARWRSPDFIEGTPFAQRLDPQSIADLAVGLQPFLTPKPMDAWITSETIGLPTLERSEVAGLLSGIESSNYFEPTRSWYELDMLMDGSSVLFPNDGGPQLAMDLTLPIRTSRSSTQVRRFRLGALDTDVNPPNQSDPRVVPERCVLTLDHDDPGMPYKGSCSPIDCDHDCTRQVVFRTETGDYVLTGCDCE